MAPENGFRSAECQIAGCKDPADVWMKAAGGKVFGAHLAHLSVLALGFPDFPSSVLEPIPLTESDETAELMLRYLHLNADPPSTEKLTMSAILGVAEAAEKYHIYFAREILLCTIRQQHRQVEHPFGALAYAIKHSYDSLANQIAEMQLSKTSSKARMSLNPRALSAWEAYASQHRVIFQYFVDSDPSVNMHKGGSPYCATWDKFVSKVQKRARHLAHHGNRKDAEQFWDVISGLVEAANGFDDCSCNMSAVYRWWNNAPAISDRSFTSLYYNVS